MAPQGTTWPSKHSPNTQNTKLSEIFVLLKLNKAFCFLWNTHTDKRKIFYLSWCHLYMYASPPPPRKILQILIEENRV